MSSKPDSTKVTVPDMVEAPSPARDVAPGKVAAVPAPPANPIQPDTAYEAPAQAERPARPGVYKVGDRYVDAWGQDVPDPRTEKPATKKAD